MHDAFANFIFRIQEQNFYGGYSNCWWVRDGNVSVMRSVAAGDMGLWNHAVYDS